MRIPGLFRTPTPAPPGPRPRDDELDLFGITHAGKVRATNEDHFLLCTVHSQVVVHAASLPAEELPLRSDRLATIMMVADGVGASAGGSDAARLTTETIARYVNTTLRCYEKRDNDDDFLEALRAGALEAHDAVRAEALSRGDKPKMATTLTLGLAMWPWLYVVQVGDSRCYYYHEGRLEQLTRDQTYAQDMLDEGVLTPDQAEASPFRHVLSSAIGADEAHPDVTRVNISERGSVIFLCTDGLTKHVSDEEIAHALATMQSSEQVCRDLVALTLARGATDNVTLVAGRARKPA